MRDGGGMSGGRRRDGKRLPVTASNPSPPPHPHTPRTCTGEHFVQIMPMWSFLGGSLRARCWPAGEGEVKCERKAGYGACAWGRRGPLG